MSDTTTPKFSQTYAIAMLPPPGLAAIAPHGFPASPSRPFPATAPQIFRDAMAIRVAVFCEEQHCALDAELDVDDGRSWHWVLYETHEDQPSAPVSVIRIVPPPHEPHPNGFVDVDEEPYCKLGRVATLKRARGRGLSRMLVDEACKWLGENSGEVGEGWTGNLLAHAQVEVEGMYKRQGFVTDERLGRWDEEGIEHLGMWRRVEIKKGKTEK